MSNITINGWIFYGIIFVSLGIGMVLQATIPTFSFKESFFYWFFYIIFGIILIIIGDIKLR